ncbi:DNA cytosine methyltransferase [uncultured Prevotella sp.]|uniref:DNA cytosine methyltransferase n=1 Tax=uncultured Prevotella sp. TaxID=159272 RepID=UPI0027E2BA7E|nr:DNA cytosine methyltransferase [uncultured Prevotella sp.]
MEINKRLRGLSLFANVGIAEAYLQEIGVDILIANELIEDRARFYSDIYQDSHMIVGDITNDELRTKIVDEAINKEVDFILATPPCQGMSMAGNRVEFDERNQLIYYAVDVVLRVKPKFVFIENVPTILRTKIVVNGETMLIPNYLHSILADYHFNDETLVKAMDHGVPQMRERNIFLLVRNDIDLTWNFPNAQPHITLQEAIGDLPSLDPLLREGLDFTLEKFPSYEIKRAKGLEVSKWHYPPKHSWKQVEWMLHTPTGKSAIYNPVYYPQKANGTHVVAHHNHYRRMYWDKPARTITQNNGVISSLACVHPGRPFELNGEVLYSDPRVLSIYELLIVSSLPKDWAIPDWASESFIRKVIGEGIPSKLVKEIMCSLICKL